MDLVKDILSFKKNIGADVTKQLQKLEGLMQSFVLAAGVGSSLGVDEIRALLLTKIMPAMCELWNLYMVATKGPGQTVRPGAAYTAGEHLFSRLQAVETSKAGGGNGGSTAPNLERRMKALEAQIASGVGQVSGPTPSVFGIGFGAVAGAPPGAGGPPVAPTATPGLGANMAISNLNNHMNTVAAKVKELHAQLGNATVSCGGQAFCSIDDYERFIVQHLPGNIYAYFYDMVSLLQRGCGKNHVLVSSV